MLVDILEGIPQGKGLDQWQSGPIEGFDSRIIGTNDYGMTANSELFLVTGTRKRMPPTVQVSWPSGPASCFLQDWTCGCQVG